MRMGKTNRVVDYYAISYIFFEGGGAEEERAREKFIHTP